MATKSSAGASKRNPTVLVTDSRDRQPNSRSSLQRTQTQAGSKFITVDNVLQYASDIPSMQQRFPPPSGSYTPRQAAQSRPRLRRAGSGGGSGSRDMGSFAGTSGLNPKLQAVGRLASIPQIPPRSSKVTEKLVLLPETVLEEDEEDEDEEEVDEEEEEEEDEVDEGAMLSDVTGFGGSPGDREERRLKKQKRVAMAVDPNERLRRLTAKQRAKGADFMVDNEAAPLLAEEEALRKRRVAPEKAKSYAERLPKARRAKKLPRVTAYCTAQAYKMSATAVFAKESHDARTKLYDDCLYTAYHLPLLPGRDGYRVRSSPILRSAEGKVVLDEEIARNEQRDYHEEFPAEAEEHSFGIRGEYHGGEGDHRHEDEQREREREREDVENEREHDHDHERDRDRDREHEHEHGQEQEQERSQERNGNAHHPEEPSHGFVPNQQPQPHTTENEQDKEKNKIVAAASIPPNALSFAEMFVFSYGVVVFWNFTERQEKEILADLAFSSANKIGGVSVPLATMPLAEEDFETEEFHFQYSIEISRPRVYNDMITLRSGDHMIKLAISHGIAQSTKLSFFEEGMARQMAEAKDVPRRLALTGHLGMRREEVFRILGKLFKSRVEVNLSSNMLDVPNFFWDSEPTLHPLYIAVREYLEIKPRIQVLNERCRVFLDLIEILSDSIADNKMSRQTWIIIVLIFISIVVTIGEVILRFGILSTRQSTTTTPSIRASISQKVGVPELSLS